MFDYSNLCARILGRFGTFAQFTKETGKSSKWLFRRLSGEKSMDIEDMDFLKSTLNISDADFSDIFFKRVTE